MAKKICLYGILSAFCITLGFVEHLISFDFIAPGVKIGLANSVALLLICWDDFKGAFAVNITRILLSAFLFSAPSTLIFSISGGIFAFIVMVISKKAKILSEIGISVLGAVAHNVAQIVCALLILGNGVLYYSPFLMLSALISGILTGFLAKLCLKYKSKLF